MARTDNKAHLVPSTPLLVVTASESLLQALESIANKTFSLRVAAHAPDITTAKRFQEKLEEQCIFLVDEELFSEDVATLTELVKDNTKIIILGQHTPKGLTFCFKALSVGAMDFLFKDDLISKGNEEEYRKKSINKIISVVKLDTTPPPLEENSNETKVTPTITKQADIVFCEDCGARNIFQPDHNGPRYCAQCDDLLENHLINKYKRTHYVTVIGAGEGSYSNVLNIIPKVTTELSGAIIVVIADMVGHVDTFTRYLDSICDLDVHRIKTGTQIEGGACYIAAEEENFYMKPYSTSNRMERARAVAGYGAIDIMLKSVSESFRHNSAGLFLSGTRLDGEEGLHFLKGNCGISAVLFPANCLSKQMGEHILRKCTVDKIVGENDATLFITELHSDSNKGETA